MKSLTEWHFRKLKILKVSNRSAFHRRTNWRWFHVNIFITTEVIAKNVIWPLYCPWPWPLTLLSENKRFVIFCQVLMTNIQCSVHWCHFIVFSLYHHVTLAKLHKLLTPWTLTLPNSAIKADRAKVQLQK